MSFEAQARCQFCHWFTVVAAPDHKQLRGMVDEAIGAHVCHEPIPDSCEVKWGDHRCTVAPYDHAYHLCRCGAHSSRSVAPDR